MKSWEVTAYWEMSGTIQIEAETREEAKEKVTNNRFDIDWDEEYEIGSFTIESVIELESDLNTKEEKRLHSIFP
jgi:hypothetical protein